MRQTGKSSLSGWRGYPLWVDEMQEQTASANAASILFIILKAHEEVKRKDWGNTPRQRKMRTKYTNRFKTHLNIRSHVYHLFGELNGNP